MSALMWHSDYFHQLNLTSAVSLALPLRKWGLEGWGEELNTSGSLFQSDDCIFLLLWQKNKKYSKLQKTKQNSAITFSYNCFPANTLNHSLFLVCTCLYAEATSDLFSTGWLQLIIITVQKRIGARRRKNMKGRRFTFGFLNWNRNSTSNLTFISLSIWYTISFAIFITFLNFLLKMSNFILFYLI